MMSLFDWVLGVFLLCVWLEYPGSLVDDVVEFLKRKLK